MPIIETYSQRKRRAERGDAPEVFQYDDIPAGVRRQVRQILGDAIGPYWEPGDFPVGAPPHNNGDWEWIRKMLCREMQTDSLSRRGNPAQDVLSRLEHGTTDDFLDVLDLCCRFIENVLGKLGIDARRRRGIKQSAAEALAEINYRLREAAVGYEYSDGELIRIDSALLHVEAVKPALALLRDPRFKGAQEEFLEAHRHWRGGNAEDAITWANKAFESTMKTICEIKGWTHDKGARGSDLIKVLRQNGYFPDYLDNSFDQLLATLASGLPQVRNNAGGHGQGPQPRKTPDHVARYALNLAATNIVFLVEGLPS